MSTTQKTTCIDITNLPAAVVLAALWNNQFVQGVGGRFALDGHMTIRQAQTTLTLDGPRFEMLEGRPIYVDFAAYQEGELTFDPTEYDAVRGEGAAVAVIQHLTEVLEGVLYVTIEDRGARLLA